MLSLTPHSPTKFHLIDPFPFFLSRREMVGLSEACNGSRAQDTWRQQVQLSGIGNPHESSREKWHAFVPVLKKKHIVPSLQNVEHHRNQTPQAKCWLIQNNDVWTHVPRARTTVASYIHDTQIYEVHPTIISYTVISSPINPVQTSQRQGHYFFLEAMGTLGSLPFAPMKGWTALSLSFQTVQRRWLAPLRMLAIPAIYYAWK